MSDKWEEMHRQRQEYMENYTGAVQVEIVGFQPDCFYEYNFWFDLGGDCQKVRCHMDICRGYHETHEEYMHKFNESLDKISQIAIQLSKKTDVFYLGV